MLQGGAGLQPVPGSEHDRKDWLVERLTGASSADLLDTLTPGGASRQEELRQRLRKKTEKSGQEELQEKAEEEESDKQDWDVVRGLQHAAMLLTKVRSTQLQQARLAVVTDTESIPALCKSLSTCVVHVDPVADNCGVHTLRVRFSHVD